LKEPRCVEVCPAGALAFGDFDDPQSEVSKRLATGKAEIIHPEYGLNEKVSYIGLPKRFIAGTVIFGDKDECAENVSVTLINAKEKKTIKTNNYGDFEFEGLPSNEEYVIKIEHTKYKSKEFNIQTKVDIYLGEVILT
jgi:ferredoxin